MSNAAPGAIVPYAKNPRPLEGGDASPQPMSQLAISRIVAEECEKRTAEAQMREDHAGIELNLLEQERREVECQHRNRLQVNEMQRALAAMDAQDGTAKC